ncbi:hypothetical protein [Desulfonatronum sp. SC1]|uniref:hypothetical protein n=1 Tax=Desulfonatronum sp. SC1 TaxID=2109626 RepID=UPI000D3138AB|nr:hypothetical protein [Desulfonatronum sp. SC1]PTN33932.1 hypothetical protein C6366_13675 [Desulfonatronum sp. SC1]
MSYNWGPLFIVPTELSQIYSGTILLREDLDRELLAKQLTKLNIKGPVSRITNPWYYRKKGEGTWVKIGESEDQEAFFPVRWDTTALEDGEYEVMGFMHVFVKQEGGREISIARQNVVDVTVKN